jgi:hypothetical protein
MGWNDLLDEMQKMFGGRKGLPQSKQRGRRVHREEAPRNPPFARDKGAKVDHPRNPQGLKPNSFMNS